MLFFPPLRPGLTSLGRTHSCKPPSIPFCTSHPFTCSIMFSPLSPSFSLLSLSLSLEAKVVHSFYSFQLHGNYDDQVYDDALVPCLVNNNFFITCSPFCFLPLSNSVSLFKKWSESLLTFIFYTVSDGKYQLLSPLSHFFFFRILISPSLSSSLSLFLSTLPLLPF